MCPKSEKNAILESHNAVILCTFVDLTIQPKTNLNSSHCREFAFYILADRLNDFSIKVSNDTDGNLAHECTSETNNSFQSAESRVYICPSGMSGRYVRIQYIAKAEYLMLCEVQVQGGG